MLIIHINPDEEIMSLISRAKRSDGKNIVLAVPQRSIILESLTNLYLLKRELDRAGKYFAIITQDARGEAYARRAGIETQPYSYLIQLQQSGALRVSPQDAQILSPLEMKDSFEEDFSLTHEQENSSSSLDFQEPEKDKNETKSISNSIRLMKNILKKRKKQTIKSSKEQEIVSNEKQEETIEDPALNLSMNSMKDFPKENNNSFEVVPDFHNREKIEEFYGRENLHQREYGSFQQDSEVPTEDFQEKKKERNYVPREKKKSFFTWIAIFILVTLLATGGFFSWKYLPEATLVLNMLRVSSSGEMPITLSASGKDQEIRTETFFETVTLTESFPATGGSGSNVQKSGGLVTIYNEYSEQSQVLVATTRILSEDEKVYRTVQSVVVPGKKTENGEIVPGKVEVEVRADGPGESYNKEPSRFTIPGLKGTPKYEYFYAKSEDSFTGGGKSGSEIFLVSSLDVEKARLSMEVKVKEEAFKRIQESSGEGWTVFPEAMKVSIEDAQAFPGENTVAKNFEYSMTARIQIQAIRTKDLEKYVWQEFESRVAKDMKIQEGVSWIPEDYNIKYGEILFETEKEILKFKALGNVNWKASVEKDKFIQEVVSKKPDEVVEILRMEYAGVIEKIDITRTPAEPTFLFPRISSIPSRIHIEMK